MTNEKDKFVDTMKLVERAKEDIFFAERDREAIGKLRAQLRKVDTAKAGGKCPKCAGALETFSFHGVMLDRCVSCHGIWLDAGELEAVIRRLNRGAVGDWLERLIENS